MKLNIPAKPNRTTTVFLYGATAAVMRGLTGLLALIYSFKLSPAELGTYGVVTGIASAFAIFSDAGSHTAVMRNYFDKHSDPQEAQRYIASIAVTIRLVALAILAVVALIAWFSWGAITAGKIPLWPFLPIACLHAYLFRTGFLMDSISRVLDRPYFFAGFRMTQVAAVVIFSGILVFWFNFGVIGALLANVAGYATSTVVRATVMQRAVGFTRQLSTWADIKSLLSYGVPLIPMDLADWGRNIAMRLVLLHSMTVAHVGAFFFANSLASLMVLLTTALDQVFQPAYFKRRITGGEDFRKQVTVFTKLLFAILAPIYVAAGLFAPGLLHLFMPRAYEASLDIVPVLILALFIQVQQMLQLRQLLFIKKTALVSTVSIVPVIVCLGLAIVVSRYWGLEGVAWLICITTLAALLAGYVVTRFFEHSDFPLLDVCGTTAIVLASVMYHVRYGYLTLNFADIAARLLIVAGATALCTLIWIWPNRVTLIKFLRH